MSPTHVENSHRTGLTASWPRARHRPSYHPLCPFAQYEQLRIGTWNVEYASTARNPQRLSLLPAADADICVLAQIQDGLDLGN